MNRTVKMYFITDQDETMIISVPRAKAGLEDDSEAVIAAMDEIIASDIVISTTGEPKTRKKANVVEVNTRDFEF